MKFRFIKEWTDLDRTFKFGEEIYIEQRVIDKVKEQIKKYGEQTDLFEYGKYRIPFTYLNPIY